MHFAVNIGHPYLKNGTPSKEELEYSISRGSWKLVVFEESKYFFLI